MVFIGICKRQERQTKVRQQKLIMNNNQLFSVLVMSKQRVFHG